MKPKLKLLFLLSLFSITNSVNAQYFIPWPELYGSISNRTMAIVLPDTTTAQGKSFFEIVNAQLQKDWKFSTVKWMSTEEYSGIVERADTNYLLFNISDANYGHTKSMTSWTPSNQVTYTNGVAKVQPTEWTAKTRQVQGLSYDYMRVALKGPTTPGNSVRFVAVDLVPRGMDEGDMVFVIQQFSRMVNASKNRISGLDYFDAEKNVEYIKNKTLLIPREYLDDDDSLKLPKKLEYPFKVTSSQEMNLAILNCDTNYVYPKPIYSTQHRAYAWILVGTADGAIRGLMVDGGIKWDRNVDAPRTIKPGTLSSFYNGFMQKVNNQYQKHSYK